MIGLICDVELPVADDCPHNVAKEALDELTVCIEINGVVVAGIPDNTAVELQLAQVFAWSFAQQISTTTFDVPFHTNGALKLNDMLVPVIAVGRRLVPLPPYTT